VADIYSMLFDCKCEFGAFFDFERLAVGGYAVGGHTGGIILASG